MYVGNKIFPMIVILKQIKMKKKNHLNFNIFRRSVINTEIVNLDLKMYNFNWEKKLKKLIEWASSIWQRAIWSIKCFDVGNSSFSAAA